MNALTLDERVASLERRLEALEGVLIELLQNNAHLLVGGQKWADVDTRRLQDARHE